MLHITLYQLGGGATNQIRLTGQGAAAATHQGHLDYSLAPNVLSIHTMMSIPSGQGLGSLLLFEAALRAIFYGLNRVEALNTALIAQNFYLKSGFHPSQQGRNLNENIVQTPVPATFAPPNLANLNIRIQLARRTSTWDGPVTQIKDIAFQAINGIWI